MLPGSTCGHPTACRHSIDNAAQRLSGPTARKPSVRYPSDSNGDTHVSAHAHGVSYTCGHANTCTDPRPGSHPDQYAEPCRHSHSNTYKYARIHGNSPSNANCCPNSHDPADQYAETYANSPSDADRCPNGDTHAAANPGSYARTV